VGVNPELLDPTLYEDIVASAKIKLEMAEYEVIEPFSRKKSLQPRLKSFRRSVPKEAPSYL
jgi:hypothetical protein